jgi:hypothetical protein
MKVMLLCLVLGIDDTTFRASTNEPNDLMKMRMMMMNHVLTRNRHALWSRRPVLCPCASSDAPPEINGRNK